MQSLSKKPIRRLRLIGDIAVADSYDAMTSERSYKAAMRHEDAIKEILRYSGPQFDPAIVVVFIKCQLQRKILLDMKELHHDA